MRFLKVLLLLLILLLIVGGIVLWKLPADVAYRQGSKYMGPIVLSGVSGTIWDGHADGISVFARDLGEIDWHMPKITLLQGRMVADMRIQGADVDAAGILERHGAGAMTVRDVRFRFPASLLQPSLDMPGLNLAGTIGGVVSEASVQDGMLRSATGNARWSEAGVSGGAEARFTDILADFGAQPDGSIAGTAHDDGQGNLAINATFRAAMDGFQVDTVLRARNGDERVTESLRHVGEPQPDGSTKLSIRGRMFKIF